MEYFIVVFMFTVTFIVATWLIAEGVKLNRNINKSKELIEEIRNENNNK